MSGGKIIWILVAIVVNGALAYAARRRRALSPDGAIAAWVLGAALLALDGGLLYWSVMLIFFLTATAVSRLGQEQKKAIESIHEHGSERTWVQVTANGLVGLTAAVLTTITEESAFLIAAVTSFAATNADTWGSEIGVLSRRTPRSILTGREVEPGMSGGVTLEGTIASLLGSVVIAVSLGLIGVLSQLLTGNPVTAAHVVRVAGTTSIVLVCGFVGSIIDSVLGASVQAQYRTGEGSVTERARGEDGPHTLVRGLRFMTNDVVNLLSTALASAAGAGLYLFVFR